MANTAVLSARTDAYSTTQAAKHGHVTSHNLWLFTPSTDGCISTAHLAQLVLQNHGAGGHSAQYAACLHALNIPSLAAGQTETKHLSPASYGNKDGCSKQEKASRTRTAHTGRAASLECCRTLYYRLPVPAEDHSSVYKQELPARRH